MTSYAARTDRTHAACVEAIRRAGLHVRDLSRAGQGCADLLVTERNGMAVEVEVKDGGKPPSGRKLTPAQVARLGVPFWVVGCPRCAVKIANRGESVMAVRMTDCCGVRGPVDGLTYWRETKGGK